MRKTTACMLAFLMLAVTLIPGVTSGATDNSWARILLSTGRRQTLTLNAMGSYFIYENGKTFWGGTLTVKINDAGLLEVTHSMQGLLYTGERFVLAREYVSPTAGAVVFTDCDSDVRGNAYLGHFHFTVETSSSGAYIQVVNEVPLDQYLYGVIGHEMSNSFPLEALKAQAVAAASLAVTKINTGSEYHFSDSSSSMQVYSGYDPYDMNVIAAVDATVGRGEILTVNGKLLRAFYCSSNGGETSLPEYEWGDPVDGTTITETGYEVSLDPYELRNPSTTSQGEHETVSIPYGAVSAENIGTALYHFLCAQADAALGTSGVAVTYIHSVSLHTPPTKNGKIWTEFTRNMTQCTIVYDAAANGAAYTQQSMTFEPKLLKNAGVFTSDRSLRIYWAEDVTDVNGNATGCIIHRGRWGAGIGLSQRGAQQMANEGMGYRDILSFYYPNAIIENITLNPPLDPLPPGADPVVYARGYINADGVSLREGPSTYYARLATLNSGTSVDIYGELGAWDYVMVYVEGQPVGFVHSTYVTITERIEQPVLPLPDTEYDGSQAIARGKVVNVNEGVNFREEATSSSKKIAVLPLGTTFDIYARSGAWYYVYVGTDASGKAVNRYGYLYGHYVGITEYITPDPVDVRDIDGDGAITVRDALAVAKHAAGMKLLSYSQQQAADIDHDSNITIADAVRVCAALRSSGTEP